MKELWVVVVLIWYICVNENYLFTRADTQLISFDLNKKGNVSFSCNTFSRILIVNISISKKSVPYSDTKCKLNGTDIANIHRTCGGRNECVLGMEWSTSCIREYGYYNVSYKCNATCNFEESQCEFTNSSTKELYWRRVKGSDLPNIIKDVTIELPDHTMNTSDGHFMMIKSKKNRQGTMKTQTFYYGQQLCLSFWYFSFGFKTDYKVDVELYILRKEELLRTQYFKADNIWYFFQEQIYLGNGDYISFRSSSKNKSDVLFGLDDISLSPSGNCEDNALIVTGRLSTGGSVTLTQCPSFFLNNLNVELMYDQSSQVCQDVNNITQSIEEYCATYYRWTQCTFNLENITKDDTCLQPDNELNILYQCLNASVPPSHEITPHESQSAKSSKPMYTIIIVSASVIVLTALWVIIGVCSRRKNAKHSQPIGTRQDETANDMTDSTDYIRINYNEMRDIDISKINENKKDKITTHRELQGNKASVEKEKNNCNKYESLATIRNSVEHIYESECVHDNQYQSLTNQRKLDEHTYESTEHASMKHDSAQYQSLTNRSESDNHAYTSTSLHTNVQK